MEKNYTSHYKTWQWFVASDDGNIGAAAIKNYPDRAHALHTNLRYVPAASCAQYRVV